jgi:O-antigen ligase
MTQCCLLGYGLLVPWVRPIPVSAPGLRLEVGALDLLSLPAFFLLCRNWHRLRPTLPLVSLLGYVLVAFVSLLSIEEPAIRLQAFLRAVRLAEIALPFFLGAALESGWPVTRRLMRGFVLGGGVSMVMALLIFELQLDLGKPVQWYYYGAERLLRAGGIFSDSTAFGHLLAVWGGVAFMVLVEIKGRARLAAMAGWVFLMQYGLLASVSRAAMLGLLATLGALLLLPLAGTMRRRMRRQVGLVLALLPLVLAADVVLIPQLARVGPKLVWERVIESAIHLPGSFIRPGDAQLDRGTSGRVAAWLGYLGYFQENPVTGIGYKALFLERAVAPDNQYLAAWVETGILGFALLASFMAGTLAALARRRVEMPEALMLFALWGGTILHGVSCEIMTFWGSMPPLLAMVGSALAAGSRDAAPGHGADARPGTEAGGETG